jgi:membrane protease YdiL (CAAX protease family)
MPEDKREAEEAASQDEWVFKDGRFVTDGPAPPLDDTVAPEPVEVDDAVPTRAAAVKKPPVKKPPVKKQPVKKQPVKKPPAKKPAVKKPPAKRPAVKKQPKVSAQPPPVPALFLIDGKPADATTTADETVEEKEGRKSALIVVAASIGLGVVVQAISFAIGRHASDPLWRRVTIGNLLVFGLYGAVAFLVAWNLGRSSIQPRMVDGSPGRAVASGIAAGLGAALVVVGFVSAVEGRWSSDRNVLRVVAEHNLPNVVMLAVIACVLAPLTEELLFRGLLVESLRSRGRSSAVLGGAVAFALWHLNPLALRYYIVLGILLGFLYWRFGLAGSIGAHAAFNAALFAVAVLVLSAAPHAVDRDGIRVELPASWSVVEDGIPPRVDVAAESRTGATLAIVHLDASSSVAAAQPFVAPPNARLPHEIRVAQGTGIRFELITPGGRSSEVVVIQRRTRRWVVTLVPEGSEQALREFDTMLGTLLLPSS